MFAMKWVGLICNKKRFFTFIKILDSTEVLSQLELKVQKKWLYSNIKKRLKLHDKIIKSSLLL